MKQIVFEKASLLGIKLAGKCDYVEIVGRLTPQIATELNVGWFYDRDHLPRPGGKKYEIEAEIQNCTVALDVKGVVQFHMSLPSPLVDKFTIVRVGGRKKAKSTWLVVKFRARVVDREEELIHFWKTARHAEGTLTIDAAEQPKQTKIPGADGKAIQDAVAKVAGKAKAKAIVVPKPGDIVVHDSKLVNLSIALHEDEHVWHSEVAVLIGLPPKSVTTKLVSAIGNMSRPAALVAALGRLASWARAQDRPSAHGTVVGGSKEVVAWCEMRLDEITAASDLAQVATPITFLDRMRAAKTADEGRDILHEHEQTIHSLMTHHGLAPLCGPRTDGQGYTGFSVTTAKERKAAIKDLRLQNMDAGDALHALIEEGVAMDKPWTALHTAELATHFKEPDDDTIPGAEDLEPVRVLKFEKPTHRATIRVGTLRDGSNAIDYEVSAVANADHAEPVVASWTSTGSSPFETMEAAIVEAAAELRMWALKLKSDSPKKSPLCTQGRDILAWAQAQWDQAQETREAVSA